MVICSKKSSLQQPTQGQRRQVDLAYLLAWIVFCVVTFSSCGSSSPNPQSSGGICSTPTPSQMVLNMVYDDTEEAWIKDVVNDFNSQNTKTCNTSITVNATPMGSGDAMKGILDGKLQPDIWSPASSIWISLLNMQWHKNNNNSNLVSTSSNDSPSLLTSPMVIAMWRSQAQALDWPRSSIGWSDISNLIADPKGWASYNHPEWGKFHFINSNPIFSNEGLEAVISMNYAGICYEHATPNITSICMKNQLASNSLEDSIVNKFVSNFEQAAPYYSSSSSFLADQMFSHGLTYLNAVPMEESLVVQANERKKYPNLADKVVAIYPTEGTIVSNYPFAILQGSWVSQFRSYAAQGFRDFLLSQNEQNKALQDGFHPTQVQKQGAPLDSDHGVDTTQPAGNTFPIPDPTVVQGIQSNWEHQRRPFDVMLVVDTSAGMNFPIDNVTKIDGAKTGLKAFVSGESSPSFVNLMQDSDQLGLTTFSDSIDVVSNVSSLGPKRQDLLTSINNLTADGGTMLFDTIAQEFSQLQQLPSSAIRVMIVLSNQDDNQSDMTFSHLTGLVTPPSSQELGQNIQIFTIAYGSGADTDTLTQLAQSTGGQEFSATPQNIQDVYQQIGEAF
jgi:Ca-activated chloride channel family protein